MKLIYKGTSRSTFNLENGDEKILSPNCEVDAPITDENVKRLMAKKLLVKKPRKKSETNNGEEE